MTPEDIKQSIDLAEYIRSCGIELKPHGKNDLVGRCPLHPETKGSFVVTPSKQVFHCFGCDKAGDIFKFVEYYHNVDFKTAKEILEKYLSVGTPKSKPITDRQTATAARPLNTGLAPAAVNHDIFHFNEFTETGVQPARRPAGELPDLAAGKQDLCSPRDRFFVFLL